MYVNILQLWVKQKIVIEKTKNDGRENKRSPLYEMRDNVKETVWR